MTKHELEARIESLEHQLEVANQGLGSILAYVSSDKFRYPNDTMNPFDVHTRVREILNDLADAAVTPYGLACDIRINREIAKHGYTRIAS